MCSMERQQNIENSETIGNGNSLWNIKWQERTGKAREGMGRNVVESHPKGQTEHTVSQEVF